MDNSVCPETEPSGDDGIDGTNDPPDCKRSKGTANVLVGIDVRVVYTAILTYFVGRTHSLTLWDQMGSCPLDNLPRPIVSREAGGGQPSSPSHVFCAMSCRPSKKIESQPPDPDSQLAEHLLANHRGVYRTLNGRLTNLKTVSNLWEKVHCALCRRTLHTMETIGNRVKGRMRVGGCRRFSPSSTASTVGDTCIPGPTP